MNVNFLYSLRNWTNTSMCEILEHENPEIVVRELIFNHDIPKPIITKSQTDILNLNIQSQTSISNLNTHVPHHQYSKSISIPLLTQNGDKSFNDGHFSDQKIMWNEFENRLYFRASKLVIGLRYNFIHRVFNSGKFSLGGRFYGAVYQQLPSAYRKHIFINDNPTIELDYSALHIRMLYHMEGVDFRKDPYEGIEERKKFKTVQLILINAEDRKKAVCGIRKELMEMGYRTGLKDEDIEGLIETFVSLHPTISKFLHSGIGLKLQNIDSKIMDNILTNLTKMGIPALPVHDSVIVEKRYEEELEHQMVNCYKKVMNFEPIIH